jgi:DNA-binding CsgD family transcriptional regulator
LLPGAPPTAEVSLRGAAPMTAREIELWPALMPTHPYLPFLVQGSMQASKVTDAVDLVSFEHTELYELLLAPRGARFHAALVLERSPQSMLLLSLWRAGGDFTAVEMEALEVFRSVFAAALAFRAAVEAARLPLALSALAGVGARGESASDGLMPLTARQRQVAALVEIGLTNEQIARRLGITSRTVRKHLEDLFRRTGTCSRTQLATRWRVADHADARSARSTAGGRPQGALCTETARSDATPPLGS